MTDIAGAEGQKPEGNTEFADEFARLGQQDRQAPDGVAPDPEAEKLDAGTKAEPDTGQGGNAPPDAALAGGPGAKETPDPWANATPEQLAERDKLIQANRSQAGRLSAVSRELNAIKTGLTANGGRDGAKAKELDDRFKVLVEEYPDVAGPLVDVIQELRGQVGKLTTVEVARTEAATADVLSQQAQLVEQAHPGLVEKVRDGELSADFIKWAETQPRYVIDAINRNGANGIVDAAETIDIMDRFMASRGEGGKASERQQFQDRRQRQLDAGRLPDGRQPAVQPGSQPDDFESEWARLREREKRAARK